MTQEQFKKEVDAFFQWSSNRERPARSWWLSLAEYAEQNFNREYGASKERTP